MLTDEGSTGIQFGLRFNAETLQIMLLRLAFDVDDGEDLIRVELTDLHHVVVEVGVEVEARNLELAVGKDLQDAVFALESAKILSTFVSIQATHRVVKPNIAGIERGYAFATLLDFLDFIFGQQVTTCVATFHGKVGKLVVHRLLFLVEQHQRHLDNLCLAVGVRRKIAHLRAGFALREVVFLVAGDTLHGKTLHIMRRTVLAIAIDHIIGGTIVILMEHIDMNYLLSHKEFRLQLDHRILTVFMEDNDIVQIGAVAYIFVGLLVLLTFQALARPSPYFSLICRK